MKIPFLRSVVPPHVFCLLDDGVTYARVARGGAGGLRRGAALPVSGGLARQVASGGAPLLTREAVAEAVKAARALSGGRLTRASVVFPDAWARILPVELETMPVRPTRPGTEMVLWKLKKLLPQAHRRSVEVRLRGDAGPLGREAACSLAATARARRSSRSNAPSRSSACASGTSRRPRSRSSRDSRRARPRRRAATTRCSIAPAGSTSFFIAPRRPIRSSSASGPPGDDEDHDQEARLSLSYYAERLKGPGLRAVYVHDRAGRRPARRCPRSRSRRVACRGASSRPTPASTSASTARPELLAGVRRGVGESR